MRYFQLVASAVTNAVLLTGFAFALLMINKMDQIVSRDNVVALMLLIAASTAITNSLLPKRKSFLWKLSLLAGAVGGTFVFLEMTRYSTAQLALMGGLLVLTAIAVIVPFDSYIVLVECVREVLYWIGQWWRTSVPSYEECGVSLLVPDVSPVSSEPGWSEVLEAFGGDTAHDPTFSMS